jgi:hypothetical protein
LFFVLSVVSCSEAAAQTSKTKYERWEYTGLNTGHHDVNKVIKESNKLGEEGWELVVDYSGMYYLIFKRKLP